MRIVNPIGRARLFFRRTTSRYGKKGTISRNQGYLSVKRNADDGRFVSR